MAERPSQLAREAFIERFGGVFEHSPWIAEAVWDQGLGPDQDDAAGLHAAMCRVMRAAPDEAKLRLIRAHPDLAGRLAVAGGLAPASSAEQASAGLDRCSPAEFARFNALNRAYRARFGFPFVTAVRGRSRADILAEFERRLGNEPEAEFAEALRQIERIALLRLQSLLA